jgi:hypothetical protein
MIDICKIADLILLMVDDDFGFEIVCIINVSSTKADREPLKFLAFFHHGHWHPHSPQPSQKCGHPHAMKEALKKCLWTGVYQTFLPVRCPQRPLCC